jgi:hypothetical protein
MHTYTHRRETNGAAEKNYAAAAVIRTAHAERLERDVRGEMLRTKCALDVRAEGRKNWVGIERIFPPEHFSTTTSHSLPYELRYSRKTHTHTYGYEAA